LKKNLVLTGMMGVGKSTVGKNLAKKLKLKFIDIDQIIEDQEKKAISEIFKENGENHFRKIEKKITLNELKKNNVVIALGGGAFIDKIIRKKVIDTSISIWLDLSTDKLLKRLKNVKKRPLLSRENLEISINKIYSERKKFYNESKLRINCDLLELNEIVNKIVKLYESSRN
jgi:shikimate kinase